MGLGIPVIANYNEEIFRKWITNSYNGYLIKLDAKKWAKKIELFNFDYSRYQISKDIHNKINYKDYIENYIQIFDYFSKINLKKRINLKKILIK